MRQDLFLTPPGDLHYSKSGTCCKDHTAYPCTTEHCISNTMTNLAHTLHACTSLIAVTCCASQSATMHAMQGPCKRCDNLMVNIAMA